MNTVENVKTKKTPWWWVPTLYFAEGVPYFLVNNISVMMFTKLGVPNGQMAFFTTLLYFPWFLKGIWSPIVDVVKTKRWWIVTMQALMTAMMILLTITLPKPDAQDRQQGQNGYGAQDLLRSYHTPAHRMPRAQSLQQDLGHKQQCGPAKCGGTSRAVQSGDPGHGRSR